jgi:hypothetical protein
VKKQAVPPLAVKDLVAHPLCDLVPGGMSEEEHSALVEDLKANGMRIPITLYQGKILDGRARYRAANVAGVAITHTAFEGDDDAARHYVMSTNLHRRTLSGIQKAYAVAEMYKKAIACDGPKPSQEQMAKRYGVSKQSISLCLKAIESKNTMLLTRLRRGEVTRGELEEEFYDQRTANTTAPTSTQETGGDIFGAAPLPPAGVAIPDVPQAPRAATPSSNVGTGYTAQRNASQRATETPASALAGQFKALSESDRVSFVALAWPWLEAAVVAHQATATAKAKPAPAARAKAKA